MRRRLVSFLLGAVFLITACGSQGQKNPQNGTAPSAPKEKVTIRWIGPEDPENFRFKELKALFEQQNPDINVEYMYTPDKTEDKLRTMMSAGDPPDIAKVNDDYVVAYAVRNMAVPLDEYIQKYGIKPDGHYDVFWDWPKVDGKHYAWPITFSSRVLYINVDMFEQAGLPLPPTKWGDPAWTWDHLADAARKLTKDTNGDGKPDVWGVSLFNTAAAEETFARTNGGTGIYSGDGRSFALGEGKNLEAMEWLQNLVVKDKVHPTKSDYQQQKADDMFASGRLAMIFEDGKFLYSMRQKIGTKFKWAMRPVPKKGQPQVEASLDTMIIPKGSKHPEEAFRFLKFLTEEPAQKIMAEIGYGFPVKHEWTKKYFVADGQMPLNQDVMVESMTSYWVSVAKATNVELARAIYRRELDKAWNGQEPVAEVLRRVKGEVDKVLKEFPEAKF